MDSLKEEVKSRARLLLHLGYSQAEATARCRQNLLWDFELHGKPPLLKEVDALVAALYARAKR